MRSTTLCPSTPADRKAITLLKSIAPSLFNEVVQAYGDYQDLLNRWSDYSDEFPLDEESDCLLPDAGDFFDFDDDELAFVTKHMRRILRFLSEAAGNSGGNEERLATNDEFNRQSAFTDAVERMCRRSFTGSDRTRKRVWLAFATIDEAVFHSRESWTTLAGSARDIEGATRITRTG